MCAHHLKRLWQLYTLKLNERATYHLAAMLCSMRRFDPEAYAEVSFFVLLSACLVLTLCQQVPEYFKRGLNCMDACNLYLASKTEDRIQARLEEIAAKGLPFALYTDDQFDDIFL
jgi:hypothetical protein